MTGKSPALEAARAAARQRAYERVYIERTLAERPDASPEAALALSRDVAQLERLSDAGFAVRRTSEPTVDLFKEFERRKRGREATS